MKINTYAKAIAYGNGRTGEIVHAECWGDYADARRNYDAQGRPMAFGIQSVLYLEEARAKSLRDKNCAHCGKSLAHPAN